MRPQKRPTTGPLASVLSGTPMRDALLPGNANDATLHVNVDLLLRSASVLVIGGAGDAVAILEEPVLTPHLLENNSIVYILEGRFLLEKAWRQRIWLARTSSVAFPAS